MMKTNRIELSFTDKTVTRLAYYPYGKQIYEEQVKPHINFFDDITYIVFPNHIVKLASSFVQGFFEEIIEKVGYEAIGKKIIVESSNDSLKTSIFENLKY